MDSAGKIDKSNIEEILPLTPMQESMLFQYLSNPHSDQYFEQLSLRLRGKIDNDVFKKAWQFVTETNEMLRTVYRWDKLEQPVQVILKNYEIPVREYDFSGFDEERKLGLLNELREKDYQEKINLRTAPFRITFCKLSSDDFEIIISNHHILYDGWSNGILLREFLEAYGAFQEGKTPVRPVKTKFKEFIQWGRNLDQNQQKDYWREYLGGFDAKTLLPYERFDRHDCKPKADSFLAREFSKPLSDELSGRIARFVKDHNLTTATLFYAAWGILLQKYNNSPDVIFGTTVSGRPHQLKGVNDIAGLFINTLPLRINTGSDQTIQSLLDGINQNLNGRENFEATSLAEIKLCSAMSGKETLFDSIIVVENYPLSKLMEQPGPIQLTGYSMRERTNFDLTLAVMAFDKIEMKWIYNCEGFSPETVENLAQQYIQALTGIIQAPNTKLGDLEILTEAEKRQLLVEYNQTRTDFPKDKTLPELFEEQAARLPDHPALVFENQTMSYRELNQRANQLAGFLREKGIKPGGIVGLLLDRSIEMMVAIWGILKAGAAYLPLDPEFPKERNLAIFNDAGATILIAHESLCGKLGGPSEATQAIYPAEFLIIEQVLTGIQHFSGENLKVHNNSGDHAYIMYTSGSTGLPKGILTRHYNISRVVKNTNYIDISDSDVILQLSNYAFDGSTFDIFGALLNGAKLVLIKKEVVLDGYRLGELIKTQGVTVFFITTALFNTLVDLEVESLKGVRKILFGGERVSVPHVRKALETLGPDVVVHVYGPTETTVYASYYPVREIDEELGTIPIGKPLANTELYVLDRDLKLLPKGAPGELYIGGEGLADGYLNRREDQRERFIDNPFFPGKIIYKTGDLVRWTPDGNIVFLDRLDKQVKLRGFRLELGEIEAALLTHSKIREAVVIAREEVSGGKFLCAYLVTDKEISAESAKDAVTEIRNYLLTRLPDYMVPSRMVFLKELPLNPNGKVDQKKLMEYTAEVAVKADYEAPSTDLEKQLLSLWTEILGTADISINDSFFDLGGHSLKATVLTAKIHKKLGIEVPLSEVLKNPTIKELAQTISKLDRKALTSVVPIPVSEYYEVSSAQKRLYVQEQMEGIGTSYNMPITLVIEGALDQAKLEEALSQLVNRHEALRTSFCMVDGVIKQKIQPKVELKLETSEASLGVDWNPRLQTIIRDFIRPFDLSIAPLLRVKLIKLAATQHLFIMDMHHIISDGVSLVVIINELAELYGGRELEPLKIQYKDFTAWENQYVQTEAFRKQENYWLKTFAGAIPVLNMPTDFRRPEKRSFKGDCFRFSIDRKTTTELLQLAKSKQMTLNALLLSIYALLLSRYSAQDELVIGSLSAGRRHPDVESMVGMFNNFLPVRIALNPGYRFDEFLKAANGQIISAYENQDYPFDLLLENLAAPVDPSRNPLFDTMLILHNELESVDNLKFGDLALQNFEIEHHTSKLDFKLDIYSSGGAAGKDGGVDELKCILEYNIDLFSRETIKRLVNHLNQLITEVTANPEIMLPEIEILPETEKHQILVEFNDTQADYPKDRMIYQLFEEQVRKTPGERAVIFENSSLTYGELNAKANQLARRLRQKGVKPDSIVGVLMERSLEMMIGIMATLKSGAAYLPMSPEYPNERIKYMLQDSAATLLLTTGRFQENAALAAPMESVVPTINLEDGALYSGDDRNLEIVNHPGSLAYVIYTSGSTGKPKGVMIEHYSLVNRLNWMQKSYSLGPEDVILQKTPYTFDVSVWELFWWSMTGAKVCFLTPGGEKEPATIVNAIEKHKITTMHFVPSMLTTFLGYLEHGIPAERLSSLRQVFSSGEALHPGQVTKFNQLLYRKNGTKLHNLYGPTEATVDVSYFDCSTGDDPSRPLGTIPIGKPIDNIQLYILDTNLKPQPIGVPGELHIAGDGLARGYLKQPELTTAKFVLNPFRPGERMYKTGDLARLLPDGNIEYLGRIDNQVKVRGNRIELGEIETELLKHPAVREAVTIAREDGEGNKYLCAYLVLEKDLPVIEFREHLSKSLPEYMIPSYFIRLEKIPLTSSGKADRKSLPEPEGDINTGREYEAPTNAVEEKLVEIWREVLGVERVSINDNFFELGGHSLKAANLAVKIHKAFNAGLSLGEIFTASTIKNLALCIETAQEKAFTAIDRIEVKEYHEVSSSQKRLFIINQLEGNNTTYNLPSAVIIEGPLDVDRFREVFSKLIKRHESFRTSFKLIGDEPVQMIHDDVDMEIEYSEAPESKLKELVANFIRPFELEYAPLLRVALVKFGNQDHANVSKHLLMFDFHHIIADGVSAVILVNEFAALYAGDRLPELKIQYKDFAAWQNAYNESEEIKQKEKYWKDKFTGAIPVLNLPTDYPRPAVQSNEGEKLSFRLDNSLVEELRKVAQSKGATLFMALLTVYNTLLYHYSGQEDIIVGSPTAGRQHADLENMIGMFVNTLALRNFPEGGKSFAQFLEEVKENSLLAIENQDYQFERLVDSLNLPRDISRNPMFDTMFVLQNMGIPKLELENLKFLPYPPENKAAKFDLTVEVVENPDETSINIEYCTRLFKGATIERMAQHFSQIIREVVQNPELLLEEISLASAEERRQILDGFNNTLAECPKEKRIYQLFEEQVQKQPDQIAVMFEGQSLTYGQLNSKSNQLARLLREKGLKPDGIVGIMVERSLEMMIGIMAVVKAGGAYLPVSPDYPDERIRFMLQDSDAKLLLTYQEFMMKAGEGFETLCLEDEALYAGDDSNLEMGRHPQMASQPSDLAYIIYTSGSTGKPKGVMIEHYSLVNRLNWMQKANPIGPTDRILQKTPYTFDVSVWELFWWSMTGAGVCFLKPGGEKDPEAIVEAIETNRITTMHFVPSMLGAFLGYLESGTDLNRLKSLKQVFASGEALSVAQVEKFNELLYQKNGTRLINLYGPTEATVDVSYFDCSPGTDLMSIPIGKPIDNIQLFILNKVNHLQPIGVPGELHIAGVGLARGYLKRPELTAEKFVPNPFRSGERMYKTGDLAKWNPDGNIEYLGRIDNQVKVRGFRIELGEIEAELLKHPDLKEVVVAARDDRDGNKYLAAYLVTEKDLPVTELREHLAQNLPEYMIPSYFVRIDQLPLTPNGKVDRKALPEPEGDINTGREYQEPTNEVEEKLVGIWKEVLGVDRIGIHDRFFELGGYSILLIKMHTKIEQLYPGRIKITDYFSYPTIAKVAEFIINSGTGPAKKLPLTFIELPAEYFQVEM
ncbi:MAG TPA: amino acid adenylation domain-containing protein, partial [Bacillota bacterium]|nr:amino acid adenylation domain-containing protein [Bacillota bacterium]